MTGQGKVVEENATSSAQQKPYFLLNYRRNATILGRFASRFSDFDSLIPWAFYKYPIGGIGKEISQKYQSKDKN